MPGTMTAIPDVFATIGQLRACRTPQEVGAAVVAALAGYGLRHYAIGGMPPPSDPNPTSFMFHNWPEEWTRMYFERAYAEVDPIPRVAMTCAVPMTVGEVRAGLAGFVPGPEAEAYFQEAERITGGKGLIVPIFGPHGHHGIVVFAGEAEAFAPADRGALHMLAIYAHNRMLELFGRAEAPVLSAREVEVLRLARNGDGDEAIAQRLGISTRTVRFHFENARKKLQARTRAEALISAVGRHLLGA